MPRAGGALAALRARDARAAAASQAKKKGARSNTAAALIELHRTFFESLSPQQYEKLYAAFLAHGKAEPGFITAKELGPLLKALGDEPRPRELQDLISLVDADGNALLDFTEFLTLVAVRSQHPQAEEEILQSFRLFDAEGVGTLPVSVFRQAMTQLCGLSAEETDAMIGEAREITRQHDARQRELDGARIERRLQRRRSAAAVAMAHATALASSVDEDGDHSTAAPSAPAAASGSPRPEAAPLSVLKSPSVPPPKDDVIYYEPLVRILFSF